MRKGKQEIQRKEMLKTKEEKKPEGQDKSKQKFNKKKWKTMEGEGWRQGGSRG